MFTSIHSASFFLIAINVPLNDTARGSLKKDRLISLISWPGVNPYSSTLNDDGWVKSILAIFAVCPEFNSDNFMYSYLYQI